MDAFSMITKTHAFENALVWTGPKCTKKLTGADAVIHVLTTFLFDPFFLCPLASRLPIERAHAHQLTQLP